MQQFELFDKDTQAIIYGFQANAIQRMLDFDYVCKRDTPSIAAVIRPRQERAIGYHKVFWGKREIVIPIYKTLDLAAKNHVKADVLINFSSFRSAYSTSIEALDADSIKTVVIIAEGIPERQTRHLIKIAKEKQKLIIGPATVGGIVAGAFKIANTAGTLDNIVKSKLYRPGSVGFVSKSGGMSNELYFMISQNSDGIYEGIAIGGDRYPGTTLLDHILRFEANPKIKMIVCLGEVGGRDEYSIAEAVKDGLVKKPIVMWVTGTCSKVFPAGVQFGHAGAMAGSESETANAKNKALLDVGIIVPSSYDDLGDKIHNVFEQLIEEGELKPVEDFDPPKVPMNFKDAEKIGLVRRPTDVVTTISNEKGDILTYNGVPIDKIIRDDFSLGYVIGLLWFRKELPDFAQKYIEIVLKLTADHGPAVSGAHNAIVTARAGKDLMSSLASGILTIGPRFGGAISDAAKYFKIGLDSGKSPEDFVSYMKDELGINIPGIGHRIKSVQNPDIRVELLKEYVKKNFPNHPYLDYALDVEKVTTAKRNNLILNVDGCIGICFLDLMENLDMTPEEKQDVMDTETLNGLFVLGRSIGMMGHIIDQKRQRSALYRQPYDEILYTTE